MYKIERNTYWCIITKEINEEFIFHNPYGPAQFSISVKSYILDNRDIIHTSNNETTWKRLRRKYTEKFLNGNK